MDGAEQNPNTWNYDEAIRTAWQEQELRNSPEHADEQLRKCLECVAARNSDEAAISTGTLALCGNISIHAAEAALERDAKTRTPLVQQEAPGLYRPTATVRQDAAVPPDCFTILPEEQKAQRDTRNISEKYLDAGLLACIGCVVNRNGGEIPTEIFGAAAFAKCPSIRAQEMGYAIRRILALPDSPLQQLPRSKSNPRYVLTEYARRYATSSETPAECQAISGDAPPEPKSPKTARPPKTPKPLKLTKTRKQIAAARRSQNTAQAARTAAEPIPVNMAKKRASVPLRVRQKSTDSMAESCLHCIASRHEGYEGQLISTSKVRLCIGAGLDKTKQAFKRLAAKPNAPLNRDSRQMFRLTIHALQAKPWGTPAQCQNITFEQKEPKGNAPTDQKARRVTRAAAQRVQRLTIQEHVVQASVESIADPAAQQHAARQLQTMLAHEAVAIKRAPLEEKPAVVAHKGKSAWYYFGPGKKLTAETPGMQRAFFLVHGLDRLIYGEPTDTVALREELQLRPTDSLRAMGQLVAHKLIHQLPPFEYRSSDDLGDEQE